MSQGKGRSERAKLIGCAERRRLQERVRPVSSVSVVQQCQCFGAETAMLCARLMLGDCPGRARTELPRQ
jgi:hypothetical protein